jgi:hypothetical protein
MTRTRFLWALVIAVVVGVGIFVARSTYWGEVQVPAPLRGAAARNPFYAAQRLAESLGASTARQGGIAGVDRDSVVVLTAYGWDLSGERRLEFERWVEAGGRLVVDASLIVGGDVFERWSGIARAVPERGDDAEFAPPEDVCTNVDEIATGDNVSPARQLLVCGVLGGSWLETSREPVWGLSDETGLQVVRTAIGGGTVTAINTEPFRFRDFLEADHGELFVAATQLESGDHIVFVSEEESSSLLGLAWRYGAPLVIVLLLWIALALWRGAARFGPLAAAPDAARRSLAEQIRGTGRFTVRLGGGAALHGAALRALREAAVRRIAGYDRLEPAAQIAVLADAAAVDRAELARAIDHPVARRSSELRTALALLETARRHLTRKQ